MRYQVRVVRTVTSLDGFFPHMFRWRERVVRVLSVEKIQTCGRERRYWVRTAEGSFELALTIDAGKWYVRRCPSWLGRVRARWHNAPRYPLPSWRRRARATPPRLQLDRSAAMRGGDHANGLALV